MKINGKAKLIAKFEPKIKKITNIYNE